MIHEFRPNRRNGGLIAGGSIIFFIGLLVYATINIMNGSVNLSLSINLIVLFVSAVMSFLMAVRFYGLLTAKYTFDRDHLLIDWGLRKEKIPISDIEWVRAYNDAETRAPLPFVRLPGQILGHIYDHQWGSIDYFASEMKTLILVGTSKRIFGISPKDPNGFVNAFNRNVEMGSLDRSGGRSEYASVVLVEVLRSDLNRFVIFLNLFLNIGMMVWVTYLAPKLASISLGFTPDRTPLEPVSGAQIILLPILSWIFSLIGFFIGLVLYRSADKKILAKMLWVSNIVMTILLLIALLFLLRTGVSI